LIYVRRSAKASREQTKQQKQAAKDAAQPMLWVDIRGDDGQDQALVLLLGNSGPSLARDVKVVLIRHRRRQSTSSRSWRS
jgi:hypothetical protein